MPLCMDFPGLMLVQSKDTDFYGLCDLQDIWSVEAQRLLKFHWAVLAGSDSGQPHCCLIIKKLYIWRILQ